MRSASAPMRWVLIAALTTMFYVPWVSAKPNSGVGLIAGTGFTVYHTDDATLQRRLDELDSSILALGAAARLDFSTFGAELNALYWHETFGDAYYDAITFPLLTRFSASVTPRLGLSLGAGLEFRIPIAATEVIDFRTQNTVNPYQSNVYAPLSLSLDIYLPDVGMSTGIEGRYGYELTARSKGVSSVRDDYALFLGTLLF